ncbi:MULTISPECIES: alpha/beta hydrolase [Mycobacteriaceae]|uniref:alpha/beta hydrolase n=1 Tax=Mycobacteriaceae TaxID=1762 RepID=UPI0003101CA8|nr:MULTISPECIES: alpha/beta hydrolase [Mycobacteriaceae]AIL30002.1 esterase [Mycolicibacterium neoaurum VKM Ac-1815D]AMO04286.1 esterase [Mycolicibacterium neoaurum]AXK77430.1 alpha/beta hydrolase [Mycolicibacterium neoaurum]KJQ48968.1 esterase [Mycolicibacterium neoaurum]KUM07528.1 esterase [Mycolicibacterium neoaurum]
MTVRKPRPALGALAELVNAANAVRPLGRKGYSTLPTFAFGWPTSENAPLFLTGSLLDVLRRTLLGHYRTRNGRVSLALKALTWGLLVMVQRREDTSKKYFEDPLRAALGPDYPEAEEPERKPRGVFGTGWTRRRYVHETARYGPHGPNLADVWMRPDLPRDGKAPVLLQVPGGAWMIGMRRPQAYPMLSRLAEHGWICVSIGYRISPKHTWPDHIVDVKRAIAWVRENIAEYGGDPESVYITGGSAGGHLTALAALTPNDPKWQPGFEHVDTSVAAAVPIYGRYDWFTDTGSGRAEFVAILQKFIVKLPFATNRQVYLDASPISLVHADAPPFFVLHGADDSVIPVQEGRDFVAALRAVSKAPVIYAEIPHAQHAFDFFGSAHGHNTAAAVERFLNWLRG